MVKAINWMPIRAARHTQHTHTHTRTRTRTYKHEIVVISVTEALVDYSVGEASRLLAKCLLNVCPNKWSFRTLRRVGRRRQQVTPKRPHRHISHSARTQSIVRGTAVEA